MFNYLIFNESETLDMYDFVLLAIVDICFDSSSFSFNKTLISAAVAIFYLKLSLCFAFLFSSIASIFIHSTRHLILWLSSLSNSEGKQWKTSRHNTNSLYSLGAVFDFPLKKSESSRPSLLGFQLSIISKLFHKLFYNQDSTIFYLNILDQILLLSH